MLWFMGLQRVGQAGVGAGFPVVLSEVDTEAENAPGARQGQG